MADHHTPIDETHKGTSLKEENGNGHNGVTQPLPVYEKGDTRDGHVDGVAQPEESWATRAGLNFRSFTRNKSHNFANVELERKMQPRHLNMIAIGGRYVFYPRSLDCPPILSPFHRVYLRYARLLGVSLVRGRASQPTATKSTEM